MSSLNKAMIIGNLGQDPDVRYMPSGSAVANLSVATTEKWKDKNTGEQKESTEWHRVAVFGKLAEIAGEYLRKGSKVYLAGKLRTRKWTDRNGNDRYTTEIVVQGWGGEMILLGGRSDAGGASQSQGQGDRRQTQQQAGTNTGVPDDLDDEIPF